MSWRRRNKGTCETVRGLCYRVGLKVVPKLREFFRKVEAEVVSNSRNKIHQTWGQHFNPSLYYYGDTAIHFQCILSQLLTQYVHLANLCKSRITL